MNTAHLFAAGHSIYLRAFSEADIISIMVLNTFRDLILGLSLQDRRLALLTVSSLALAPKGPWDAVRIEHAAKTLWTTVVKINEIVSSVSNFIGQSKSATIHGNPLVWWLHNALSEPKSPNISLSLAFVGPMNDASAMTAQNQSYDGTLRLHTPLPTAQWTIPTAKPRGAFRDGLPYFCAPKEKLLTRAWYAGTYTVQTNIVQISYVTPRTLSSLRHPTNTLPFPL
ncbi:hypothetical protein M422DRAFT_252097 [Sphaerobolus stellatus SS14]|uniref:Uncharacterized protein n=1 Tax=Sphaerobolus stellatus (strain SS14) TaxID=990650 RepID=A0A0C9VC20_SPHS4|nr:hypothetical protein M422DRAFT_252097 [Sphaerobolus stellatus SS14]